MNHVTRPIATSHILYWSSMRALYPKCKYYAPKIVSNTPIRVWIHDPDLNPIFDKYRIIKIIRFKPDVINAPPGSSYHAFKL